ncbi:MAG: signal recognition particle-docking protein FtsY [Acidimicrobiales bacterium]
MARLRRRRSAGVVEGSRHDADEEDPEAGLAVDDGAETGHADPPGLAEQLGSARGVFAPIRALRSRSESVVSIQTIEEALLKADLGVELTGELCSQLVGLSRRQRDPAAMVSRLAELMVGAMEQTEERSLGFDPGPGKVNVWLFVGVNVVGKTTSIAKIATAQRRSGRSVILAAADTFRAAAVDQLGSWAERVSVEVVRGAQGGDPSAVVFDSVQRAKARGHDLVLADTAGRLHTKLNLMEELKKIKRVASREPGVVSEVLLVIDATTGQNALAQAKEFSQAVGVTGVVLTKMDGTAKGGIALALERRLNVPVKLVGVGEGPEDLIAFDPAGFVDALLRT